MTNEVFLNNLAMFSSLGINKEEEEDLDSLQEIIDSEDSKDDINLDVSYPSIIFYKSDLIKALNLGITLIQPKSDNIALKSITLIPESSINTLWFYTTNDVSYFKFRVELVGDNILNEKVCLPLVIIQKLIPLMGTHVLVYKKDNLYYIRLVGGDLILETHKPEDRYLEFQGSIDDKLAELPVESICNVCKMTLPIVSSDIRGENRRLQLTGEDIIYLSNIYYLKFNIKTPKLVLKLKDIEFLSRVYRYYRGSYILIYKVGKSSLPRYVFVVDNVMYQTIMSTPNISELTKTQMNSMLSDPEMKINFKYLIKLVSLATSLPNSTGKIGFKRTEDGLVSCISSSSGNSEFTIPASQRYQKFIDKNFKYVNAESLRKLIQSLTNINEIELAFTDKSIVMTYDKITAVFMNIV